MNIITTRHGFQFAVETHGFEHNEDDAKRGVFLVERHLDWLGYTTVAAMFGESIASTYGQNVTGTGSGLAKIVRRAEAVATKGWSRPDAAFITVSAYINRENA